MRNSEMMPSPIEAAKKKPESDQPSPEPKFTKYDVRIEEFRSKIRAAQGELESMGFGPDVFVAEDGDDFETRARNAFIRQKGWSGAVKDIMGPYEASLSEAISRGKVLHRWMRQDEEDLEKLVQARAKDERGAR